MKAKVLNMLEYPTEECDVAEKRPLISIYDINLRVPYSENNLTHMTAEMEIEVTHANKLTRQNFPKIFTDIYLRDRGLPSLDEIIEKHYPEFGL